MDKKTSQILIITAWTLVSFLDAFPSRAWAADQNPAPAQALLAAKKYQEVVDLLSPQVEQISGPQLRILGQAYSGLGNPGLALKTFSIAIVKNPKDFESKTLVGNEQFNQGKDREALLSLREAVDINPHYEPPYLLMEKIYMKKKNKYELSMLFQDMIKQIGEKPLYVSRLCELSATSGLYDDAKNYCRRGIVLSKEDPKNYVFLSVALKETGALEEAKSLMRRSAENFPKSEEAQMTYAQFLDDQKDYVDSLRFYRAATSAAPDSIKTWLGLANASLEVQKFGDALEAFGKACQISGSALPYLRKSINVLRSLKAEAWLPRYETLNETCGMKSN